MNYYNEFDLNAAAWLRELIRRGEIPNGVVDERSITDVSPSELEEFTQCHFFAGIGGWAYALRLAGVPEDRPLWTGSCPCQPFSVAGKGAGVGDPRHLWPAFRWLIAQRRPARVYGEQVASRAGRDWLSGVRLDLEVMDYAVRGADLCAAGVGAPHIRQRLFWVADSPCNGRGEELKNSGGGVAGSEAQWHPTGPGAGGSSGGVADSDSAGQCTDRRAVREDRGDDTRRSRQSGGVADSKLQRCQEQRGAEPVDAQDPRKTEETGTKLRSSSCRNSGLGDTKRDAEQPWGDSVLIPCGDGKARRIKSGTSPLVDGIPRGVVPSCDIGAAYAENTAEVRGMRLKGYGNAIVPQVAAAFIIAAN